MAEFESKLEEAKAQAQEERVSEEEIFQKMAEMIENDASEGTYSYSTSIYLYLMISYRIKYLFLQRKRELNRWKTTWPTLETERLRPEVWCNTRTKHRTH